VTLANGYGDCTDKAILLATMLGSSASKRTPSPAHFRRAARHLRASHPGGNHSIDVVFLERKKFFLDATAGT
jgi:hypothetical protein